MKIGSQILWVVALNQRTGNMAVYTLAHVLNINVATYLEGNALELIPIAVYSSSKECQQLIERLKDGDKQQVKDILDMQIFDWDDSENQ